MSRRALSEPAAKALDAGLLDRGSVLDFGCGRGEDVRQLIGLGLNVEGWDPHFKPHPPPTAADVVLLTYVLNAIESVEERAETIRHAWSLARRVLIVTVRTDSERTKVNGEEFADGVKTSRATFQHLYEPVGFRIWVDSTLGTQAFPSRPGQVLAFRDRDELVSHVASMFAQRNDIQQSVGDLSAAAVVDTCAQWLTLRGRAPIQEEDPIWLAAAVTHFGTQGNAVAAAKRLVQPNQREEARKRTGDNVLVTLALDTFHGRTSTRLLPRMLVADALMSHGSIREARAVSDRLLRFLARPDLLQRAVRASRLGKPMPSSLYVHVSCLSRLSTPLRVYAACAELVTGQPAGTTLVKLNHDRPTVSFLTYPSFDTDPHPRLAESMIIDLRTQSATYINYTERDNRPLLHRKQEFLSADHADAPKYLRLTRQELRAGLYAHPESIGHEHGWDAELERAGLMHRGHRLVRSRSV